MTWHNNDWHGWYDGDWKQCYDSGWKTTDDLVAPAAERSNDAHDDVEKEKSAMLTMGKKAKKTANRRQCVARAGEPAEVTHQTLDNQPSSSSACAWRHAQEAASADIMAEASGRLTDIDDTHEGDKDYYPVPDGVTTFIRQCRTSGQDRQAHRLKGTKISMEIGQRRTLACKFVDKPISPRTLASRQQVVADAYAPYAEEQLRQWAIDVIIDTHTFLNS